MALRSVLYIGLALVAAGSFLLSLELSEASGRVERLREAVARSEGAKAGPVEMLSPLERGLARSRLFAAASAVLALVIGLALMYMSAREESARRYSGREAEAKLMRLSVDSERARVLTSVNQLVEVFGETRDLDAVLDEAVRAIREILGVENLVLELYGSEESLLRRHKVEGNVQDIDLGEELYEDVVGRGASRLINRLDSVAQFESLARRGFKSLLVTPLISHKPGGVKQPVGFIAALCTNQRDFTTHELSLLKTFADQASLIIENAQLYRKTELLAIHDGLTNLYNYRRFREVLDSQIAEAAKAGSPLALIMGDVDYFKNYNDTHGHLQGDMVLRTVGDIMRTSVRGADIVARYGGEEFVLLLPNTELHGARLVGENIRAKIAQHRFEGEEKQPGGDLTITFGLAMYPADATDAETLIDIADRALYAGKRAGRNRLVIAADIPAVEAEIAEREKSGKLEPSIHRAKRHVGKTVREQEPP